MDLTLNIDAVNRYRLKILRLEYNWCGDSTYLKISKQEREKFFTESYGRSGHILCINTGKTKCAENLKEVIDAYLNKSIPEIHSYLLCYTLLQSYMVSYRDMNERLLGKKRLETLIGLIERYTLSDASIYETAMIKLFSVHDKEDSGIGFVQEICEKYEKEIEEYIREEIRY